MSLIQAPEFVVEKPGSGVNGGIWTIRTISVILVNCHKYFDAHEVETLFIGQVNEIELPTNATLLNSVKQLSVEIKFCRKISLACEAHLPVMEILTARTPKSLKYLLFCTETFVFKQKT